MEKVSQFFKRTVLLCILFMNLTAHVNAAVSVKVFSKEEGLSESNASKPRIYIQNVGTEVISNFTYYYYFQVENNIVPVFQIYYLTSNESVTLEPAGAFYRLKYTVNGANIPVNGIFPSGGNSIALHYNDYSVWNKTNDYSNNLSSTFAENNKIPLYVGGVKIYGNEPAKPGLPNAPTTFSSIAVSKQRIDLNWNDNSDNEDGFKIERSLSDGIYNEIATVGSNITSYQNTGLIETTQYSYRIRAYNISGYSAYSPVTTAVTHQSPEGFISQDIWNGVTGSTIADIPTGIEPSVTSTLTSIEIPQNQGDNYATRIRGYITVPQTGPYVFWIAGDDCCQLWLSTSDQPSSKVMIASVNGYTNYRQWTKYTSQKSNILNLNEGVKYYVEVLHKEGSQNDNLSVGWLKPGQSGTVPSEIVPGSVLSSYVLPSVPNSPGSLTASVISISQIDLSWTDNSNNENGFIIERSIGAGSFSEIDTLPANNTCYRDLELTRLTEYNYRVRAYNDNGNSGYSNTVIATTFDIPTGTAIPLSLFSFAVYSTERSIVRDRAVFSGGAAVGSNSYIELGSGANVWGNLVCGGNIFLKSQSIVHGDATANDSIKYEDNSVRVENNALQNASVGLITIPTIASITIGTVNKDVFPGQVIDILPGMYKKLTVYTGGTARLKAGTYTFDSISLQPDAHVQLDMSMYDAMDIYVKNDVEFADRSHFDFTGTNTYAPAVRFYTNDQNVFRIGAGVKVTGIFIAPYAEVQLNDGVNCDGALYAKRVTVEAVAGVRTDIIDPDGDADGDHVPNYSEYKLRTNPRDSLDYIAIGIPYHAMINNASDATVSYDYSVFFKGYSLAKNIQMIYPAGSLLDPTTPILFRICNLPSSAPEYNGVYFPVGRYFENIVNTINQDSTIKIGIPLPDNSLPGIRYKLAIFRSGNWEELEGNVSNQTFYADVHGFLGPMVLVQKPFNAVAYFDNSVFSNDNVSRINIDLKVYGSSTADSIPGTFTIFYKEYSGVPAGVAKSKSFNFRRTAGAMLSIQDFIAIGGRVVVDSVKMNIASPDNILMHYAVSYDLDRGQSISIFTDKPVSKLKGPSNIPDKLVFIYGGNDISFEYTKLDGEGEIRKSAVSSSYSYNFHLKDHLGSTRMVVTDAGDVNEAIMYQPYGTIKELTSFITSAAPAREKFTGKEFDSDGENGIFGIKGMELFYFGARYLDPDIGIFTSTDPKSEFHFAYAYGPGNPINGFDPNGEEWYNDWHYNRNQNNGNVTQSYAEHNWEKMSPQLSIFHRQGRGNENNLKYISKDGKMEAVFRPNENGTYTHLGENNDPVNMGTYNFSGPNNLLGKIGHLFADVIPYLLWGNTENDPSTFSERMNADYGTTYSPANNSGGSDNTQVIIDYKN